jgi:hypothetical protein
VIDSAPFRFYGARMVAGTSPLPPHPPLTGYYETSPKRRRWVVDLFGTYTERKSSDATTAAAP